MTLARPLVPRREMLRIFSEDRLVAVVRTATAEQAHATALAMADAGVRLIEITLTVPEALAVIERLSSDASLAERGCVIGAGTVLSGRQAEDALLAGARFLVSPCLVPDMIAAARARDALSMPGTLTPTEMLEAARIGADLIKVYPVAPVGGPAYISNVRRALTELPLVATGNIELAEIPAYLAAGVVGFGIGGPLIRLDLLDAGDRDGVVANARRFLDATKR